MKGCSNCRYCKCYPGGYYVGPDEYECTSDIMMNGTGTELGDEVLEDIFTKVWEDGVEWADDVQLCPGWEKKDMYGYDIILDDKVICNSGDLEFEEKEYAREDAADYILNELAEEYDVPCSAFTINIWKMQ